jgi:hypothetical protein
MGFDIGMFMGIEHNNEIPTGQISPKTVGFAKALYVIDDNHNGYISDQELKDASQIQLNNLRDNANTKQEWQLIQEIAMHRNQYTDMYGTTKSMNPGDGGMYRLKLDMYYDMIMAMSNGHERHITWREAKELVNAMNLDTIKALK